MLAELGFEALATSSGASAAVRGRKDGQLSRDEVLAHARDVVAATDLPVAGRSRERLRRVAAQVAETIRLAADGRPRRRLDRGLHRRQGASRSTTSASRSSASPPRPRRARACRSRSR
jgi:hypothetical protein